MRPPLSFILPTLHIPCDISSSLQSSQCLLALISFSLNSLCTQEKILSDVGLFLFPFAGTLNNLNKKINKSCLENKLFYQTSSDSCSSSLILTDSILSSDNPSIDASC
jgi:hypothetical protein